MSTHSTTPDTIVSDPRLLGHSPKLGALGQAPLEGWEEVANYALEWAMSHVKESTAAGATSRAV